MQLTRFSDLGLRLLMYLAVNERETPPVTVAEVAQQFNIARNHLVKVAATLSKHGYIQSLRGRTGGIALARAADQIKVGDLVRVLEGAEQLIDCAGLQCVLNPACGLKSALQQALSAFYQTLNQYTLADTLRGRATGSIQLIQRAYLTQLG